MINTILVALGCGAICVILALRLKSVQKSQKELSKRLTEAYTKLQASQSRNSLTGLSNQAVIVEALAKEKSRSDRQQKPFCLLTLSINDKQLRSDYGKDHSDYVIQKLAGVLKDSLRTEDLLGHWSKYKWLYLLPDTDTNEAMLFCDRIKSKIASFEIGGETINVGCELSVIPSKPIADKDENSIDNAEATIAQLHLIQNTTIH